MKSEMRISKSETNPKFKYQNSKLFVWNICILGIRACFELRASDFEIIAK